MDDSLPDPRAELFGPNDSSDEEVDDFLETFNANTTEELNERTDRPDRKGKASLRRAKKGRRGERELVCDECQPVRHFKKKKVLDEHKRVLHRSVVPAVCLWCAKQFFTANQLRVHQKLYFHDRPTQ